MPRGAMNSLASGTYQLFAAVALQIHCKAISVLPFDGYHGVFEGHAKRMFRFLSEASEIKRLAPQLTA